MPSQEIVVYNANAEYQGLTYDQLVQENHELKSAALHLHKEVQDMQNELVASEYQIELLMKEKALANPQSYYEKAAAAVRFILVETLLVPDQIRHTQNLTLTPIGRLFASINLFTLLYWGYNILLLFISPNGSPEEIDGTWKCV